MKNTTVRLLRLKTTQRLSVFLFVCLFCLGTRNVPAQALRLRHAVRPVDKTQSQTAAPDQTASSAMQRSSRDHERRKHRSVDPDHKNLTTIPHWSGTFNYHDISYHYTMVGTDPALGSATTVVPTYLIPLRFVFADGSAADAGTEKFEGQTAIHAISNSPLFQPYPFKCHGIAVGNTQYSDAFQRANFWNYVSTRSKDYHVLLGKPTVMASQTINVPADQGGYYPDPFGSGTMLPYVNSALLDESVQAFIRQLGISPRTLPIFVTGDVTSDISFAYHGEMDAPSGTQTYIVTCYLGQTSLYSTEGPDVMSLSHEINEWMDDPFDNFTPGWDELTDDNLQCDSDIYYGYDLLEVCDAIAALPGRGSTALATSPYVYHVEDSLFLDFFRRSPHSNSAGGQYSFFGSTNAAASPCTGHLEVDATTILLVPGATLTAAHSINNRGQIVGEFQDSAGVRHGFLLQGGQYTTIDPPGTTFTNAEQIDDAGIIVGYYDTSDGLEHGFSYQNGHYATLNFPGAPSTQATGISGLGQIVGRYVDNSGTAHGFTLNHGHYLSVDAPGAGNTVLRSVNDFGLMTGYTYADSSSPSLGFLRFGGHYTNVQFPGSRDTQLTGINNFGTFGGIFDDDNGYFDGFINLFGYPYDIFGLVTGVNDLGQIAGYGFDYENGVYVGFTAQVPTKPAGH